MVLRDHFFAPEKIHIRYAACNEISSKATLVDLREQLFKKLSENSQKEIGLGRSLVEAYRGEILLDIDERSAQRYASAGRLRSSLIACHLAQMEVYFDKHGKYPAFLIDDVDSELDQERMNHLLRTLEPKTQIFITTTKPELIKCSDDSRKTSLAEAGQAKRSPSGQFMNRGDFE